MFIPLTNGGYAEIDAADEPIVSGKTWTRIDRPHGLSYAMSRNGGRYCLMHRLLKGLSKGDGWEVDHLDRNGLNNRQYNMEVKDHRRNMLNRRLFNNNSSGYRGVTPIQHGLYYAQITVNKRVIHLGKCFRDPALAAMAYDRAAVTHNGLDAQTNFRYHCTALLIP